MDGAGYDPLSAETLADPFPAYTRLRAECPVHRFEGFTPPFFTLSRHADVLAGLRDWELWSIRYGDNAQYLRASGLFNDPPEHTRFRKLFNRAFTPRAVERLEGDVEAFAVDLLDAMVGRGEGDFYDFYASKLPILVIADMLGVPRDDLALFREMCDDLTAMYNVPDPTASAEPRARLDSYFQGHIDERRATLTSGAALPDDVLSGLVLAEHEGTRLTDDDMRLMLVLLLLGGLETSTALLTNVLWRLLQEPERWEAVKADPSLIPVVVEESLRFDPPILGLFRTPTSDISLHGVTIPAKAKVMLCFASANRDERRGLADPEAFRLDRDLDEARDHLSFGFGAHFCPGAPLARLEARVTLRLLAERMPALRLTGSPERIVPFILWGRQTLPVAWGPR